MTSTVHRHRRRHVAAALVIAASAIGTVGLATADAAPTTAARPEPTVTAIRPEPTVTARQSGPTIAPTGEPAPTIAPTGTPQPPVPGTTFRRTELYFGTDRIDDPDVSDSQFAGFVARVVTPRFPDGLTQLKGQGQFLSGDGTLVREKSFVIVLLYPLDDAEANREIEDIRRIYKGAFDQESVLRADSTDRVSF